MTCREGVVPVGDAVFLGRRQVCLECGYSLEGNVSGVCPECGEQI